MTHFWCYDLSCMSSLHFPLEILLIAFLLVPRMKFTTYVMRIHCFVFILLVVPISLVCLCLAFSLSLEGRKQFFDVKGSSCLEMFVLRSPEREREECVEETHVGRILKGCKQDCRQQFSRIREPETHIPFSGRSFREEQQELTG